MTHRRPGVTLTEVLVALFVMALGMLALLTLFPLGAIKMAQALKDDRTAQTAAQAEGYLQSYWRHTVQNPASGNDPNLTSAFTDPQASPPAVQKLYAPAPILTYPPPPGDQPSYPVFVDPLGFIPRPITNVTPFFQERSWVARSSVQTGNFPPLIPRRNLLMQVPNPLFPGPGQPRLLYQDFTMPMAMQTCTLLDDMTFQQNAMPSANLDRQGRYNWAAILQRPRNGEPFVANLTILVFDGRPSQLPTAGDEVILTSQPVPLSVGSRVVTLDVPNRGPDQAPLIRRGGWIMDGTLFFDPTNPANNIRNANFYRIAGLTEISSTPLTTRYDLDLETPIKGPVPPPTSGGGGQSHIYLFAGLSEVFEKAPLRPDARVEP